MTNASVVIVNYNSGRFLEACVASICRSDCSLEVIVIDNASTDGSESFLNDFPASNMQLKLICNDENRGFSAAINQGVGYSKSENLLLLNPDCLVFPHTIRLLTEELDSDSTAGIVGGLVFNSDGSEQRGCRRREPTLARSLGKILRHHLFADELNRVDMTDEPLPKKRVYVDAVSGSFLMIRRTTFSDVGGMDENFFLHFEDLDLCHRVRDIGWKVAFVPDISIFHYQGGSSEHLDHRVSWEKHRSMGRYQYKHHIRNLWPRAVVFFMVWGHFVLQRMSWMYRHTLGIRDLNGRQLSSAEWTGLSCITTPASREKANRLLVMGVIDEHVRDIVRFGTMNGWSFYACSEVVEAQRTPDVHGLLQEYFEKVPLRDAPEFNALLITPSSSCRRVVDRLVKKFGIRRIAIVQLFETSDGVDVDNAAKLFETELDQESLTGDLMKDDVVEIESKLFSLPSPTSARDGKTVVIQRASAIEDCFLWLST